MADWERRAAGGAGHRRPLRRHRPRRPRRHGPRPPPRRRLRHLGQRHRRRPGPRHDRRGDQGARRRRPRLAGGDRRRRGGWRGLAPAGNRHRVPRVRGRRRGRRTRGSPGSRSWPRPPVPPRWSCATSASPGSSPPSPTSRSALPTRRSGPARPPATRRSPSRAVAAAVEGYDDAGMVSTTKHFPGHGSVTADSHETLPVLALDAGAAARTRPEAVRGRRRRRRARGDDGPPRRTGAAAGDAVEPGAEGLRLPARRPRLRGPRHHRLARHGRRAEPATSQPSGPSRPAPTCC